MPFFDWSLLKSRTLHPDIGIPADDTQGLPYLGEFDVNFYQNYGLAAKANSGTDNITGFLFTADKRYLLGSGEAIDLYAASGEQASMFAIDSLSGHVFATTDSGIINNPIIINGNNLGWSGGQSVGVRECVPMITFINISHSKYVGFGIADVGTYAVFEPGGSVVTYSNYTTNGNIQPCTFYNGLYTIYLTPYSPVGDYGFIPLKDAPLITPAYTFSYSYFSFISYSFTESALMLSNINNEIYGYDGINDPALTSSFIKLGTFINSPDVFGYDPLAHRLLSISPSKVTVGGHAYYPVYVYNSVTSISTPTPQQYARPVKNYTVNGHLNWRKQR